MSGDGQLWRFVAALTLFTLGFGGIAYVFDELLGLG